MKNSRTQQDYRTNQRDSQRSRHQYDDDRSHSRSYSGQDHPGQRDEGRSFDPRHDEERGPRYDDSFGDPYGRSQGDASGRSGSSRYDARESRSVRDEYNRDGGSWMKDRDDGNQRGQFGNDFRDEERSSSGSRYDGPSINRGSQQWGGRSSSSSQQDRDWSDGEGGSHYRGMYRRSAQPYSVQGGSGMYVSESLTLHGPFSGKGPKGYKRSEEQICDEANQRLERHGHVDASEVEVSCKNGVLTLKGKVEDRRAKREAEECVEDIYGVNDVMNELKVDKGFFASIFSSDNDESKSSSKSQSKNS